MSPKSWLRAFLFGLALYAALCLAVRVFSRSLVYSPPATSPQNPTGSELIETTAADGAVVHALWFPAAGAPQVIAYFHGGGGSIDDDIGLAQVLVEHGFAALLVEYRGYGRSRGSGSPSEAGLYADAEAALREVGRRGFSSDRISLWGYSLGSGVASELAVRGRGSSLVLIAPFTSVPDVASHFLPILPMSLLFPDRYDNLSKAPLIRLPTAVFHGDDDSEIPVREGRALSSAIAGATFTVIHGAGHVDIYDRGGLSLFDAAFRVARP